MPRRRVGRRAPPLAKENAIASNSRVTCGRARSCRRPPPARGVRLRHARARRWARVARPRFDEASPRATPRNRSTTRARCCAAVLRRRRVGEGTGPRGSVTARGGLATHAWGCAPLRTKWLIFRTICACWASRGSAVPSLVRRRRRSLTRGAARRERVSVASAVGALVRRAASLAARSLLARQPAAVVASDRGEGGEHRYRRRAVPIRPMTVRRARAPANRVLCMNYCQFARRAPSFERAPTRSSRTYAPLTGTTSTRSHTVRVLDLVARDVASAHPTSLTDRVSDVTRISVGALASPPVVDLRRASATPFGSLPRARFQSGKIG